MTRISSNAPEAVTHAGEPRFDAAAIYTLVAALRVRTYEDLLAPHWVVPDRSRPAGSLDASRFVRCSPRHRAHVVVSLPAPARSEGWDAGASSDAPRTVTIVPAPGRLAAGPDAFAPCRRRAGAPAFTPGRLASLRAAIRAWFHSVHSWGSRSLRPWRDTSVHRWLARRPRG